ncbi:MAG: hypothetical protein HC893_15035 [Chloroflexaceae bacterium]|nr:hypothetical protein [Chloroflexaceae bacterium]
MLLNIILNAVAAMPNSGELTLRTRNVNDPKTNALFIEIEISDTGIGMTPEVQVRIFDPFFTTKPEGSGLGLAVCQRLVSQHRGSISVESVPGEGSTFRIRLPRVTLPG